MPAGDFIAFLGEIVNVSFQETSPDGSTVTLGTPAATIWSEAGTAVVTSAAGDVDATADGGPVAFYAWTPATAGDYTWELKYTVTGAGYLGGETRERTGSAQVWPRTSLLWPFLSRARGIAYDEARSLGENAGKLSLRDFYESFQAALWEYSQKNPRRLQTDVTLTGSQWEYNLSTLAKVAAGTVPAAQWTPEFSEILRVEPDVDTTIQSQWFAGPSSDIRDYVRGAQAVLIDEAQAKFRFTWLSPSTGDTARVWWSAPHLVTHTASSLPAEPVAGRAVHFEPICKYAAGEALERLAAKAAGTNEQQIAADIVSFDTQYSRFSRQAERLKAQAMASWTRPSWAF